MGERFLETTCQVDAGDVVEEIKWVPVTVDLDYVALVRVCTGAEKGQCIVTVMGIDLVLKERYKYVQEKWLEFHERNLLLSVRN